MRAVGIGEKGALAIHKGGAGESGRRVFQPLWRNARGAAGVNEALTYRLAILKELLRVSACARGLDAGAAVGGVWRGLRERVEGC
jgi:hypothetical protein